jgi:hypothetical protein
MDSPTTHYASLVIFEKAQFILLLQQSFRWDAPILLKSSSTKKAGPWRYFEINLAWFKLEFP